MELTANNPQNPPSLPWKTRIVLSVLATVTDASQRRDGTVNRRLLKLINFTSPPNAKPVNGVKSHDVTVDPTRNLWVRIFVPTATTQPLPVIVFFHGGGFVYLTADAKAYDAVCRRFARKVSAVVISVNYRLAPEHRCPAQYDDGFDVLKFLDERKSGVLPENADLSCCFLAGDSAGANLAHNVAKRATDWLWNAFLPSGEAAAAGRDHEAINVCGPRAADISKVDQFPATVVFVGGLDGLQDWQRRYYEWLKRSGKEAYLVEYPNMFHAFYIFPELPESRELISQVTEFVHKQCLPDR
ncbi:hypothetical protein RHGRI_033967 [Rhododendron griersonianum]|uniref:Alpha/beta hydrolase fold-3 domain-containing protein n=1 Tax=Rhododendron griersonianum TaxID=479676 RepID=A0AAV6HZK2_9ERIC|nr:hypothetical protein RHGRI_033967 [Rhododendron griersonianum]